MSSLKTLPTAASRSAATNLKAIDEVIAVAGGPQKTAAVRSVLVGGYANSLVTDTALARSLLATQ